jgi:hypothetical protein
MVENYAVKRWSPGWFCNAKLLLIKGGFAHAL